MPELAPSKSRSCVRQRGLITNQRRSPWGQLMFAAALAEAEALDAEGNEAECLLAARRAKQMIEPG
jgi:hypothetical protein